MAWGRRSSSYGQPSEPVKAKAFSDSMQHTIDRGIYTTGLRMMTLCYEDFSFEELKLLFVAPEHRDYLTKAYEITEGHNIETMQLHAHAPLQRCKIRFQWHYREPGDGAFFVPRKMGGGTSYAMTPRADAPQDLRERYENMAENLERTSREWGLVRHVFSNLNQHGYCNTAPQMRYLWPAIPVLLKYSGQHALAQQLAQANSRAGDKARLHPAAAPYIRETYDIVTRSIMVDNMGKLLTHHNGHPKIDVIDSTFEVTFSNTDTTAQIPGIV